MPKTPACYIEPFVGGGSSFLNTDGGMYILNDIDTHIIKLHQTLSNYSDAPEKLLSKLYDIIDYYGLSCSYRGICVPDALKRRYIKTYYAKYNKNGYLALRNDFNKNQNDTLRLYVLLIYGFNHMIRFNRKGDFNLPVGNVDFNKNVHTALIDYLDFINGKKIIFYNKDFLEFFRSVDLPIDSYIFFDPPYLISFSEYNKLWDSSREEELYNLLDSLNANGIRFGITNLITHKGKENVIFAKWCKKYHVHNISSNYISYNDNTVKADTAEVFVTNYG